MKLSPGEHAQKAAVQAATATVVSVAATPSKTPQPEEHQQTPTAESGQTKSKPRRGRTNLADNLELKKWFEKQLEEGKHICELLLASNSLEDVSGKCPEFFKDVIGALTPARRKQFFEDAKVRKMLQEDLAQYIAEVKQYSGGYFLKVR